MSRKILIVDDDLDFSSIHKEILEKDGFTVTAKYTSADALESLKNGSEKPDLIVCDLMMEKDDSGFTFCHNVKKTPHLARTPILMLTGVNRAKNLPFDLKSNSAREWIKADDFAEKPIRAEDFLAKIHRLLGEPSNKHD
ncbi:MAG: response regulator [Candidatus Riflebacteria bacterium]|nr:response regulator [Candidatus Riflebacteria bacterium]